MQRGVYVHELSAPASQQVRPRRTSGALLEARRSRREPASAEHAAASSSSSSSSGVALADGEGLHGAPAQGLDVLQQTGGGHDVGGAWGPCEPKTRRLALRYALRSYLQDEVY